MLITGVAGFTGRYLAPKLAEAGYEVHGAIHDQDDPAVTGAARLHRVDIGDARAVTRLIAEVAPAKVVHLAAIAFVAHSDVAPSRKQDPGEKFPWKRLARSGVGLWVDVADDPSDELKPNDNGERVAALQKSLAAYGYGLEASGRYDVATREVVTAFQRHFRPHQVSGIADAATRETLRRLLALRDAPQRPKQRQWPEEPPPDTPKNPFAGT